MLSAEAGHGRLRVAWVSHGVTAYVAMGSFQCWSRELSRVEL